MKDYMDLGDMANANCSRILNMIRSRHAVSRKQITQLSGLSWGGMTKIVNKLLQSGAIVEEKAEASPSCGRIPGMLRINEEKNFALGLDINRMGLCALVLTLSGETVRRFARPLHAPENGEALRREIAAFAADISSAFAPGLLVSAGVAMQGLLDAERAISLAIPGVSDWDCVPIGDILREKLHCPVFVEHDPDCMLYAQLMREEKGNVLLLRIDRSIGMAVAMDGKILKGKGILELAHSIAVPGGKRCTCGTDGCLEAYIAPCLSQGEYHADAVRELMLPLASTVKNVTALFRAEKVILTGELMSYHHRFEQELKQCLRQVNCPVALSFVQTEDTALRGAALIAANAFVDSLIL